MVQPTHGEPGLGGYALALLLGVLTAGCVYDAGDRCDANQRLVDGRHCVCVEGFAMIDGECVECGPNAVADGDACRCQVGYQSSASGECVPESQAAGQSCDVDTPCENPAYPHCETEGVDPGYCTSIDCSDSGDCADGFVCVSDVEPSVCARLPDGVGVACRTQEDCASFAADYCETIFAGVCLEAGCESDDECLGDWICCPAAPILGQNLCVPEEECVLP